MPASLRVDSALAEQRGYRRGDGRNRSLKESNTDDEYPIEIILGPIVGILVLGALICFVMWLSSSPTALWGLLLLPWLAKTVPEDCNGYELAGLLALDVCCGVSLAVMFEWTESDGYVVITTVVVGGMIWFAAWATFGLMPIR